MDDRTFELHLEHHGYLMGHTSCYIPDSCHVCSCNRWERDSSDCKKCLERFDRLAGEPIPDELHPEQYNEDRRFIAWKTMQMMAIRRLTGEYTEEQAKIVKEEYIKIKKPKTEPDPAEQNKQNILTQLFG